MSSHLEEAFANQWLVSFPNLPFHREYTLPAWKHWAEFQKQTGLRQRKPAPYRDDFAWPTACVAVEINGGIWKAGGHSTGSGITRDITKTILAQLSGWVLLPLSDAHIFDGTPYWLQLIADLIIFREDQLLGRDTTGHRGGRCGSDTLQPLPHPLDDQSVFKPREDRQHRDRLGTLGTGMDLRESLMRLRQSGPSTDS